MRSIQRTILASWIGLALAGTAFAGPLEDGVAADGRGDFAAAARSYRIAANQGSAEGQFNLALNYDLGLGVVADAAEAFKWYRLAAGQGDPKAQFIVGQRYDAGIGVEKDPIEAVRWYRLAAAQGHVRAKAKLVGR